MSRESGGFRHLFLSVSLGLSLLSGVVRAQVEEVQTDWAGGPGVAGPVPEWADRFEETLGVAALSIPGQLALRGTARAEPVQTVIEPNVEHPASIAAGDLDGDGYDDLVIADPTTDPFGEEGAIYWWRQTSPGVWERLAVSEDFWGAYYVDTFDLDRDGDTDVIATAFYGVAHPVPPPPEARNGRYAWFENLDGAGRLWAQHVVGEMFWGASWIDCGDADGDGDLDLVGASQLTDGVYEQETDIAWFENLDGSGESWLQHDLDLHLDSATEAHFADLDGDGDLDVVGSNSDPFGPSNFHWWENVAGDGSSWSKRIIPFQFSGAGHLDVGDIDGDGDLDLLGAGHLGGSLGWWENLDGSGTNWQAWGVGPLIRGLVLKLGDLDGDGDLDGLAASDQLPLWGGLWWYENLPGDGTDWLLRTIDFMADAGPWVDIGDANRDGKPDAVVSLEDGYQGDTEQVSWWDLTTFLASGELTSSILDGGDPNWGALRWDATVSPSTDLLVEVRGSDDPSDLGSFVTVPASGAALAPLIGSRSRYLQYKVTLSSADPAQSPVLREIDVEVERAPLIFSDGFESGDTSTWTLTVP